MSFEMPFVLTIVVAKISLLKKNVCSGFSGFVVIEEQGFSQKKTNL